MSIRIICIALAVGVAGAQAQTTVQVDIADAFNADVVRGEDNAGAFDDNAFVSSAIAVANSNPAEDGLPDNGEFSATSIHPFVDLADFNLSGNNAWRVEGTPSFSAAVVPEDNYEELHIYASAGGGGVGLFATFRLTVFYADGSTQSGEFVVPDWFDDNNIVTDKRYYLRNNMDRWEVDTYADSNDPAVFGFRLPLESDRVLQSFNVDVLDNTVGVMGVFGAVVTKDSTTSTQFFWIDQTISPDSGGSITCTENPVPEGGNSTCTATANAGFSFTGWTGDCTGTADCDLTNVTSAPSITANFSADVDHVVSTDTNAGGSLDPTGASVSDGSTVTFDVVPNLGFVLSSISGCGGTLDTSTDPDTYTTAAVTADCTVSASFADADQTVPSASDDAAGMDEDGGPLTVNVLANDSFGADGPSSSAIVITSGATNGTAAVDDGGTPGDPIDDTVNYTPDTDFNGSDSFDYQIEDANGDQSTATVSITVNAVNDAPSFTAGSDQVVDEDAGGQTVSGWASSISPGPSNESTQTVSFNVSNDNNALFSAQPTVSASGELSYTPAADANGSATVSVSLSDDGGTTNGGEDTSAVQTFTITVNAVNDEPSFTASNPPAVDEDAGAQSVAGWATFDPGPANETGQAAQSWTVSGVSDPGLFAAGPAVATNGDLSYTPADDANGSSTCDVVVTDDGGTANGGDDTSPVQTFTITVNSVNDLPAAGDDTLAVAENGSASADVLANDDFGGDGAGTTPLAIVAPPGNGTATVDDRGTASPLDDRIDYSPDNGFTGGDSLVYEISDSNGDTAQATLSITVNEVDGGVPAAADDVLDVAQGSTAMADVLANDDFGADGPGSTAIVVTGAPSDGTATVDDGGTPSDPTDDVIDYTPDAGFSGSDSFTYEIADATGDTATAAVSVTVADTTATPAAGSDLGTVDEDDSITIAVLANDAFGGDGPGSQAVVVVGGAANGTATVDDGGTPGDPTDDVIVYQPDADFNGNDSFDYRIEDADGDQATATVSITVNAVNDAPSASDDIATVDEDDSMIVPVLANDTFGGDGPASSPIEVITAPSDGTATVDDGGTPADPTDDAIDYAPNADFNGSDSFVYRIEDANGNQATATVSITVEPVNDAPSFVLGADQSAPSGAGSQVVPDFAGGFDPGPANESGQSVAEFLVTNDNTALFATQPAIASDGTLTYTPNDAGIEGTAVVTVRVRDDGGTVNGGEDTSNPQTFEITVGVQADLSISMTSSVFNPRPGEEFDFVIEVANAGPSPAGNVQVTDVLPDALSLVSTTGCAEDPSGSPTCSLGTLAPGQVRTVVVRVLVEENVPRITNTATVDSAASDPVTTDNAVSLGIGIAIAVPLLGPMGLVLLVLAILFVANRATIRGTGLE